jgi:uncharacterized protein (TIGR02996 family)
MNDDAEWIGAVLASPGNDGPRSEYADWLEGRRDPRAGYVRAEAHWASNRDGEREARLREVAIRFDPDWLARVRIKRDGSHFLRSGRGGVQSWLKCRGIGGRG